MEVVETPLPGVLIVKPRVFGDERGYFQETFSAARYADAGITGPFVQDNHSRSVKGILRGLHYQLRHPQGKLVGVVTGEVFDVAVDIRVGSPYFGQWYGAHLSDQNHHQMYISPGFAHGFVVLSDIVDFTYKCTDYYDPDDEKGLRWDDEEVGIQWPLSEVVLSGKDQINPSLQALQQNNELPQFTGLK